MDICKAEEVANALLKNQLIYYFVSLEYNIINSTLRGKKLLINITSYEEMYSNVMYVLRERVEFAYKKDNINYISCKTNSITSGSLSFIRENLYIELILCHYKDK